jgi:type IV pilus assembly protein PilM
LIGWSIGRNTPPIGVDIGRQSVKLAQRVRPAEPGRPAALATSRQPLPAGLSPKDEGYHQWVGSAVRTAIEQGSFVGRRCVSSLPTGCVMLKNLRLPTMPGDELRDAVDWEMRDRLKSDVEVTVQYLRAGEVRQGEDVREEIIALATEVPFVERHVDMLCEAGLAPLAVEVPVTALARAFAADAAEGVHAILDVGYASSKLLILRDGVVTFYKHIEIAGQTFDTAVANHLSMSPQDASQLRRESRVGESGIDRHNPAERALYEALRGPVTELSQEIELCLRYFGVTFRGPRPSELQLVGGEAAQSWLRYLLSDTSGMDVMPADASDGVLGDAAPSWALAIGLSSRREAAWNDRRSRPRERRAVA